MFSPDGVYLLSSIGFLLALQGFSSLKYAFRSNILGIMAMGAALIMASWALSPQSYGSVLFTVLAGSLLGAQIARRVVMTSLPQLMAAFHSLVGLAAVFFGVAVFLRPSIIGFGDNMPALNLFEIALGSGIGGITFTGSVMAFLKLQGRLSKGALLRLCQVPVLRYGVMVGLAACVGIFVASPSLTYLMSLVIISFVLGVFLVVPIGGADMPVVVSMLNSYSGWAAAGIGFTLGSFLLVIVGALVGASGAFLSYVMCEGMNRPFLQVIFGASAQAGGERDQTERPFKKGSAEDAAFLLKDAESILIVPGYGMAVAKAQHALKEMVDLLKSVNRQVRFVIHPVAGRMPGHMNVLLAEAGINPDDVLELEDANSDFGQTDVALVIGANDITNPAARSDTSSSLYGMPILNVDKAHNVLFIKRSLGAGYANEDNPLFYDNKTLMLLGDGKSMVESIVKALPAA
ncbi:NAD(P)(+) transhydrogenase (Re/Si-specific) subunit beta [Candidatus Hepatobacter penaei]|uniref:NAD(P)(+) transhydrogenase (Re/Si-specific) subunit beta n=1 Tax=Candidatus Hepatobacter penaei TaxID=1274402 RepID=UPI0004F2D202|nr:NAD(P)(+) transhydrogenase (Re/Si-specific) subunit beta [Candidatus Hepatobacter penaei]